MKYTYDVYSGTNTRCNTTTNLDEIEPQDVTAPYFTEVYDNTKRQTVMFLRSVDDLDAWRTTQERIYAWKPGKEYPSKTPEAKQEELKILRKAPPAQSTWNPFDEQETGIHMHEEKGKRISLDITEKVGDAINPPHYQDYINFSLTDQDAVGLQWIEVEFRKPHFRNNPEAIRGALLFQIDKYLGRLGQKDASVQELRKAKWYLEYLIAFESNGNVPLFVKDVAAWQKD
jgi:hypothetical protein